MKKNVIFGGVVIAAMGAFLCTGCGDKMPTVQELYQANANITDTVTANVTVKAGVSSPDLAAVLGSSTVNLNGSVEAKYSTNGVCHMDGNVSVMGESVDVEIWMDNTGAYVYDSDWDEWTVEDGYSDYIDELMQASTGTVNVGDAAMIQAKIDDKKDTTASLTKTNTAYVLTYTYALSELANSSDASDALSELGVGASMLSSLAGNVVMTANYDLTTYRITYLSVSLDSTALDSIETLVGSFGVSLDITEFSVSSTISYSSDSLSVPQEVKDAATAYTEPDWGSSEPIIDYDFDETATLFYQVMGSYMDEYEFLDSMCYNAPDVDIYDCYVTYTAPDGTEYEIDVYFYVTYMYEMLTEYSDIDTMANYMLGEIVSEDTSWTDDAVEMATAYINVLGMFGSDVASLYMYDLNDAFNNYCTNLELNAVYDTLLQIADVLQLPTE